jgi:hypothetical protein
MEIRARAQRQRHGAGKLARKEPDSSLPGSRREALESNAGFGPFIMRRPRELRQYDGNLCLPYHWTSEPRGLDILFSTPLPRNVQESIGISARSQGR